VCVRSPTGFEVAWVFRLLFTHAIHVSQEKTCVFLFVVLFLHIYAYIPLISLNCIKKGAGRRLAGWKLGGRMELSLYIYIYRAGGGTGGLKAVAAAALVFLLLHLNIINDLSLYSLSYLQLSGTSKEGERWQPYEKILSTLGYLDHKGYMWLDNGTGNIGFYYFPVFLFRLFPLRCDIHTDDTNFLLLVTAHH